MVASRWLGDGKAKAQRRRMGEGPSFAITTMFCSEFAYVFRLSVSMRKVAGEQLFCVLIYMNSYIFHICFIWGAAQLRTGCLSILMFLTALAEVTP